MVWGKEIVIWILTVKMVLFVERKARVKALIVDLDFGILPSAAENHVSSITILELFFYKVRRITTSIL